MTTLSRRHPTKYDPWQDFRSKYPGWKILHQNAPLTEKLIDADSREVYISPASTPDLDVAVSEVVAHLDLGHHQLDAGWLAADQIQSAEDLARMRRDHPEDRRALLDLQGESAH